MSMFCYQCQETAKNTGCTLRGVCGKTEETANLQDLLLYVLKGIGIYGAELSAKGALDKDTGRFITKALFSTITNANFDSNRIADLIKEGLVIRENLKRKSGLNNNTMHDSALWYSTDINEFNRKAKEVGYLAMQNDDVRSLRSLLLFGLKGISAYAEHASVLGYEDDSIYSFLVEALESTTKDLTVDEMVKLGNEGR